MRKIFTLSVFLVGTFFFTVPAMASLEGLLDACNKGIQEMRHKISELGRWRKERTNSVRPLIAIVLRNKAEAKAFAPLGEGIKKLKTLIETHSENAFDDNAIDNTEVKLSDEELLKRVNAIIAEIGDSTEDRQDILGPDDTMAEYGKQIGRQELLEKLRGNKAQINQNQQKMKFDPKNHHVDNDDLL